MSKIELSAELTAKLDQVKAEYRARSNGDVEAWIRWGKVLIELRKAFPHKGKTAALKKYCKESGIHLGTAYQWMEFAEKEDLIAQKMAAEPDKLPTVRTVKNWIKSPMEQQKTGDQAAQTNGEPTAAEQTPQDSTAPTQTTSEPTTADKPQDSTEPTPNDQAAQTNGEPTASAPKRSKKSSLTKALGAFLAKLDERTWDVSKLDKIKVEWSAVQQKMEALLSVAPTHLTADPQGEIAA